MNSTSDCFQASSKDVTTLLGLLGIVLDDLNVLVGLTCSPISVVGVGSGSACSATPVCCENNSFVSILRTVLCHMVTNELS